MAKFTNYAGRFCESEYESAFLSYLETEGWSYLAGNNIPRGSKREVLYIDDMEQFLCKTNPELTADEIRQILDTVRLAGGESDFAALHKVYGWMVNGISFVPKSGQPKMVALIDFEHPERNIFRTVNQFTVEYTNNGQTENRRPDILLFINGMPLCVIELKNPADANAALWTLTHVLSEALKLLHPYMPFITEEIYCTLHPEAETIMIESWPVTDETMHFEAEVSFINHVKEMVRGIRNTRNEMNVPQNKKTHVFVVTADTALREYFSQYTDVYEKLAFASSVTVQADKAGIGEDAVSVVIADAVVYMPLEDLVDKEKELERLKKEEARLTKEIARSNGMLSNERFLSKAPQAKVDEEKAKLEKYEQMMAQVKERLAQF